MRTVGVHRPFPLFTLLGMGLVSLVAAGLVAAIVALSPLATWQTLAVLVVLSIIAERYTERESE